MSITTSTFPLRSQEEIGQGGGLSGSTRNFVSAISLAIYTATLSNRLNQTVPPRIDPVATGLGLPASSLAALAAAVRGSGSYDAVPQASPTRSERLYKSRTDWLSEMLPRLCSLCLWRFLGLLLSCHSSQPRTMRVLSTMSQQVCTVKRRRLLRTKRKASRPR